jgi:hypothetical protein
MNMELIYSGNSNVINYDRDVIQFHGIKQTDGEGNITGEDTKPAKDLANIIKDANLNLGETFEIILKTFLVFSYRQPSFSPLSPLLLSFHAGFHPSKDVLQLIWFFSRKQFWLWPSSLFLPSETQKVSEAVCAPPIHSPRFPRVEVE